MTPWIREWPEKMKHKITDNFFDVAPAVVFLFGTVWWGEKTFEAELKKHRD